MPALDPTNMDGGRCYDRNRPLTKPLGDEGIFRLNRLCGISFNAACLCSLGIVPARRGPRLSSDRPAKDRPYYVAFQYRPRARCHSRSFSYAFAVSATIGPNLFTQPSCLVRTRHSAFAQASTSRRLSVNGGRAIALVNDPGGRPVSNELTSPPTVRVTRRSAVCRGVTSPADPCRCPPALHRVRAGQERIQRADLSR